MSGDAGRRHITKHGHNVTLKTYAEGGVDDYGDATITATDSTIMAIREADTRRAGMDRDPSGAIPVGTAIFYVKDSATVSDGAATQPSEIVDDGSTYAVLMVDKLRSSSGVIAVVAERARI